MKKWLLLGVLGVIAIVAVAALTARRHNGIIGQVVMSVASPTSKFVAIVTEASVNATTSNAYRVYVARRGGDPTMVLLSDDTDGLRVSWVNDNRLSITLACGKIYQYTNFEYPKPVMEDDMIQISLHGGELCK